MPPEIVGVTLNQEDINRAIEEAHGEPVTLRENVIVDGSRPRRRRHRWFVSHKRRAIELIKEHEPTIHNIINRFCHLYDIISLMSNTEELEICGKLTFRVTSFSARLSPTRGTTYIIDLVISLTFNNPTYIVIRNQNSKHMYVTHLIDFEDGLTLSESDLDDVSRSRILSIVRERIAELNIAGLERQPLEHYWR